ncbi:copper homeostasis protein CutC [Vibrio profundi]|uniref:copper homeostasis protein CutC n=1 Tax=Vibrio profundi TaxID=1774960 RepID=UPI0037370974
MPIEIEVCIDNMESLHHAIDGGADRIELCSSLALGGLTPSVGLMKRAAIASTVPVYAMIRPRQGDFIFNQDDIKCMIDDIHAAGQAKLHGVVLGALTPDGEVDMITMKKLVEVANHYQLGITFHRAIDQCRDYKTSLEAVISLGCERVLTSGLATTAEEGVEVLSSMVKLANHRIDIMAGAGVNADNAEKLLTLSHVPALHLSGKSTRKSYMTFQSSAQMGKAEYDDYVIPITDSSQIRAIKTVVQKY